MGRENKRLSNTFSWVDVARSGNNNKNLLKGSEDLPQRLRLSYTPEVGRDRKGNRPSARLECLKMRQIKTCQNEREGMGEGKIRGRGHRLQSLKNERKD